MTSTALTPSSREAASGGAPLSFGLLLADKDTKLNSISAENTECVSECSVFPFSICYRLS